MQSILAGMAMSGVAMAFAATGYLSPVAGALAQEAIDVAVILNALRALGPARSLVRVAMPASSAAALRREHEELESALGRLREIADALDDVVGAEAVALIGEANRLVGNDIAEHERTDESVVYPKLAGFLADGHGLGAMSRAHREILHLARLLRVWQATCRRLTPIVISSAMRKGSSKQSTRWYAFTTRRRKTSSSTPASRSCAGRDSSAHRRSESEDPHRKDASRRRYN